MDRFLGRYSAYIYALLRIVAGFLILWHGSQILFQYPRPDQPIPLNAFMAVGGTIQLVGGLMIMFGFFAGFAAFIASGTMAVAYFMFHAPSGFFPIENGGNKGELAALFCFVFLYIAARGSGVWSIDSLRGAGTERV